MITISVKIWSIKWDKSYVNESGQFLLFWGIVFLVTTTLIGESLHKLDFDSKLIICIFQQSSSMKKTPEKEQEKRSLKSLPWGWLKHTGIHIIEECQK